MRKSYKQDSVAGFVFGESLQQLLKCVWVVRPKAVLVNVDKVHKKTSGWIVLTSSHHWASLGIFGTTSVSFSAFCFGNDYTPICKFNYKIRIVVGNLPIGVYIIKLESHREVVLGVGKDIGTVFQEKWQSRVQVDYHP